MVFAPEFCVTLWRSELRLRAAKGGGGLLCSQNAPRAKHGTGKNACPTFAESEWAEDGEGAGAPGDGAGDGEGRDLGVVKRVKCYEKT